MLHHVTDDGMLHWHCDSPTCRLHNCAGWHGERSCLHHGVEGATPVVKNGILIHAERSGNEVEGTTRTVHISHPDIMYQQRMDGTVNTALLRLPQCECGSIMTLKIGFTDDELAHVAHVEVIEERQVEAEGLLSIAIRKALAAQGIEIAPVLERRIERRVIERRKPYWVAHHLKVAQLMKEKTG